ncbi:MAG: IPExxxVDY family protein [Ferruginibacter sp.]
MKLTLDNETIAKNFFENSFLMGIVAPVKDYVFAWHINQKLGLKFRNNADLEIQMLKKKRSYFFSVYHFLDTAGNTEHLLYNNQHDGEFLLPEFKHLDFLWLIKGDDLIKEELDTLIQSTRMIPEVQLVTEMTNEKIKNKQHLVL